MDKIPWIERKKKPLMLIIYDKSIFSINNRKKKVWKEKKKSFLQPKRKKNKS